METSNQPTQDDSPDVVNKTDAPSTSADAAATDTPSFGWNRYAERINGRFAMIGFIALLIQELVTRKDFFTWIGL